MSEELNPEQLMKDQEREILELKLAAMRRELSMFREEMSKHLTFIQSIQETKLNQILEQTSKTNGSVARVMKDIHIIQEGNIERDRALDDLVKHKTGTSFWYTLQTNKWIAIFMIISMWAMSVKEFRDLLISIIK
jgi:hypothetical protein